MYHQGQLNPLFLRCVHAYICMLKVYVHNCSHVYVGQGDSLGFLQQGCYFLLDGSLIGLKPDRLGQQASELRCSSVSASPGSRVCTIVLSFFTFLRIKLSS